MEKIILRLATKHRRPAAHSGRGLKKLLGHNRTLPDVQVHEASCKQESRCLQQDTPTKSSHGIALPPSGAAPRAEEHPTGAVRRNPDRPVLARLAGGDIPQTPLAGRAVPQPSGPVFSERGALVADVVCVLPAGPPARARGLPRLIAPRALDGPTLACLPSRKESTWSPWQA